MGKVLLHTENGVAFWKESLAVQEESGEFFPLNEKLMEVERCFASNVPEMVLERIGKKSAGCTPDFILFISNDGNRRILEKDSGEYLEVFKNDRLNNS